MRRFVRYLFDYRVITICVILGIIGVAVAERDLSTLAMAYFISCALVSLLAILTGRLVTSIYGGLGLLATIAFISYAKMKWMSVSPNIVDIYYFVLNPGTLAFLVDGFLPLVLIAGLCVVGTISVFIVIGYLEKKTSGLRSKATVTFMLSVALAVWVQPRDFMGAGDLMRYRYVSSIFISLNYLAYLGEPVPLLDKLPATAASSREEADVVQVCRVQRSKPDLIVVQAESIVPPEIFYDGETPDILKNSFSGEDNILRPLHVETYSGGTWITTAGFVTGLPISQLGWLKSYSNYMLEGRIQNSLAKTLANCGYHTVYVSPLAYSFVNEGNFIRSIGFEKFIDQQDMGAPTIHESDAFYYEQALAYLDHFRKGDDRPVFMVILTMSAHSPWNYATEPDRTFPGEPFSEDPEMNEYFRRLAISRTDLSDFMREIERREDARPAVVLEFGDHQPGSTLPFWQEREGEAALTNAESGAYLTYFQFLSVGTELAAPIPAFDKMDVQFLGPTLLEVAGLPMDPVNEDLHEMRQSCNGRFGKCQSEERVEAHFRCRTEHSQCSLQSVGRLPKELRRAAALDATH